MPGQTSAPAKAILLGEHAVVYGMPAIALPLSQVRAYADYQFSEALLSVSAENNSQFSLSWSQIRHRAADPVALMIRQTAQRVGAKELRGNILIRSDIPIASGLGSGAAVSAALGRATAALLGVELSSGVLNELVYEVEKLHHGTPSGIDNTVVVYEKPVYFVKDKILEFLQVSQPLRLIVADTGIAALTRDTVADVRHLCQQQPQRTRQLLEGIGKLTQLARQHLEAGEAQQLGQSDDAKSRAAAAAGCILASAGSLGRRIGRGWRIRRQTFRRGARRQRNRFGRQYLGSASRGSLAGGWRNAHLFVLHSRGGVQRMTTLIKLGGSLITDKTTPKSFKRATMRHIARQLAELQLSQPNRRLVLGHGSGSYGHFEARKYNTMQGVYSAEDRMGFARVGAAASELSQLILGELLAAGVSALRFQPSAMQVARDKSLAHFATRSIKLALDMRFLPMIYGDVALDETIGGTIISTESIFAALVEPLGAKNIILLGNVDGVLDIDGKVIPTITTDTVAQFEGALGPSDGVDVTGGMRQKVYEMLELAQRSNDLDIFIANGNRKNILHDLLDQGGAVGTRISAR